MDKSEVLDIASKYAKEVSNKYEFDRMIVFGSFARGTFREDSDIDIAVIFKDYSPDMDMQLQLVRLTRNVDSRIELYPFVLKDFNISNPLAYEILKYGEIIA